MDRAGPVDRVGLVGLIADRAGLVGLIAAQVDPAAGPVDRADLIADLVDREAPVGRAGPADPAGRVGQADLIAAPATDRGMPRHHLPRTWPGAASTRAGSTTNRSTTTDIG